MKYSKTGIKVLLPIIALFIVLGVNISYADVTVNISNSRKEAFSNDERDTINVNINDDEETPLDDDVKEYYDSSEDSDYYNNDDDDLKSFQSKVDTDNYESKVDTDNYESIVDVEEDGVPGTNSYYETTFDEEEAGLIADVDYSDERLEDKLDKHEKYEIVDKDMVVQKNLVYNNETDVEYTTIPSDTEVELVGFTTQNGKKMVELMANNKMYYEDIENFYNGTVKKSASNFERYIKQIYNDARMLGSEKGYAKCVLIAILFMLGTVIFVKFLDSSVFRLRSADNPVYPYINSIARIMPGAMIGSFIIIANMFDANAVSYYFYKGFNILGRNYELIHWILQIMIILTIYMIWRIVLEGIRCFTLPCMLIRTAILLFANIASFYLCYGLSYVGVAIYVLLILYQCICVNTYSCADFGEDCGEEESDEGAGEGDNEGEGEAEPEPEVL